MIQSTKISRKFTFIVILSCTLLVQNLAQNAKFTEYNFTFNLHESKVNDLSQINGVKIYNENFTGQVLDEFLIKEPKQIDNVVQIITTFNSENSSLNVSTQTKINPNQLLSAPQIDKVWIDSYTWPVKKNSIFYSTQFQEDNSQNMKKQIVSAAYVPLSSQIVLKKILNDDLEIYVLLSTGEIQLISKSHDQLTVEKTYSYNNANENEQQKLWTQGYLYHKNGRLHLFIDQTVYFVSLNEIDDGKQKLVFYRLYKLMGIDKVLKVVQTNELFIFTDKACYKIDNNEALQVINYSKIDKFVPEASNGFADFAAFGNKFYFLSENSGIFVYSEGQVKLLRIQHPQFANGIDVQNETIMITYEINNEEYVQEYHFVESLKQLFINKVYTYHSSEPINNVLLLQKEIIINRGSQIVYGIHSMSRKLPYAFHYQTQVLQSKTFTDEVIEVRSIWSQGLRLPGYLAITENSIQLVEFQTNLRQDIQQKWVSITSQTSGVLSFDIRFIGTCKKFEFYPPEYCSITKSVQLTVNDHVNEQIYSWWIWICIAIGSIFILIIIIVIFCRYFSKKQNQFERLIESKKLKKQGSTVVEMSFENTSEITEEKNP